MSPPLLVILLAFGWVVLTGGFSLANLALGVVIALIAALVLRERLARPLNFGRLLSLAALAGLFLREVLLSALSVARLVLKPSLKTSLQPAIIAYPLTLRRDAEITLLACLITLTPGTLSIDVAQDRSILFIHVLSLRGREALLRQIAGGFEKRVGDVFR